MTPEQAYQHQLQTLSDNMKGKTWNSIFFLDTPAMTPAEAWEARHTNPRAAMLAMLEIVHSHAQDLATPTTPEGRRAMQAMNAARAALAIEETRQ